MTSKKEAPSAPLSSPDITSVDALAAQIRPAWETVETVETDRADTVSAVAPRPIERVTAQPRTDQEATMKPVMTPGFEESGERKITDLHVHEDLTMRGAPPEEPEERTEVDRAVPTPEALAAAGPPAPAEPGVSHDTLRVVDARALLHSDDHAEMALSPMRPRAITVPTGFPTGDVVFEERTQRHIGAPQPTPARAIPFEIDLPEREELVQPANKHRIRIVFGAMGGLVLLIGLGVIIKAAIGSSPTPTLPATPMPVTHATSEPAHLEPAAANIDTAAKPRAKADIPPPPPPDDDVAATPASPTPPSPTPASPPKPVAAARAPVTTPARPTPPRPPTGARPPTTPQKPKGGIVRDSPF